MTAYFAQWDDLDESDDNLDIDDETENDDEDDCSHNDGRAEYECGSNYMDLYGMSESDFF